MSLLLPGMYVATDSAIHRLDPRVKMGAALILMILPFAAPSWQSGLILSAFVIGLALLSAVPILALLRTLRAVFWLGFFMFFFYAFTTPGRTALAWGPITITWEGLLAGGAQMYRLCLLVIVASVLSYATSPSQLAHGLEALLSPLAGVGLPVRELAMVLTIALRFVPTLSQEIDKILKAQQARGANLGGTPWHWARSWVSSFVPIFVSAFRRAEHLAMAMEARGFRGVRNRTRMIRLQFGWRDLVASLVLLIVSLTILGATHLL